MRVWAAVVVAALTLPAAATAGTVFLLDGRGWGHGVGMSQWGAEGYARHGYGYRQILAHYYPHTHVALAQPRDVRVLLLQKQASVRVGSSAPFLAVDARGRKLHLPARSVVVDRRFLLRHLRLTQPVRFEPGAAPLEVDLAGYRGDVVVETRPGGLTVVNVLPLDRYLRGVVPWEVPTGWDEAAYEAQAVAARSYTLATLHPHADFDLYPDTRDQMYGGIRAERPQTNLAIGATAGQVLTWDGTVIRAYYFSSSGGWTSAIQDAWPGRAPEPYLVSVRDPYDSVSPHHRWPTQVVSAAWLGGRLGLHGVRDVVVDDDGSHHVATASFLTPAGWKSFSGAELRQKLRLQSTYFSLGVFSLDPPSRRSLLSSRVIVRGEVRALHGVQLQRQDGASWRTVAYVHPRGDRFAVTLRTDRPLRLRLVAEGVPTAPVVYRVS